MKNMDDDVMSLVLKSLEALDTKVELLLGEHETMSEKMSGVAGEIERFTWRLEDVERLVKKVLER